MGPAWSVGSWRLIILEEYCSHAATRQAPPGKEEKGTTCYGARSMGGQLGMEVIGDRLEIFIEVLKWWYDREAFSLSTQQHIYLPARPLHKPA